MLAGYFSKVRGKCIHPGKMDLFSSFHSFSSFSTMSFDDLLHNETRGTSGMAGTYGTSGTSGSSGTAGTPGTSDTAGPSGIFEPSGVLSSLPGIRTNQKKRGRPRKVAIQGEEQRRKITAAKWKKKIHLKRPCKDDFLNYQGEAPRIRFFGDQVNTKKMYLPEGWKAFATKRSSGRHKGNHDLIYVAPNNERIRSRNDLFKWVKEQRSDINPMKFLFTRTPDVLMSEENVNSIIFRNASSTRKRHRIDSDIGNILTTSSVGTVNTILSERGRELLLDDGEGYESDLSSNLHNLGYNGVFDGSGSTLQNEEQTSSSSKKTKTFPKPSEVPIDKTLECLKSPYFALKNKIPVRPVSMHAIFAAKWIPPRSPYNLIQEDLYHDAWKLLIATIFLNSTSGKLAIPIIHEFLARWPSPHEACSASLLDIMDVVELLGLGRSRAATIIRFSHEYLTIDWKKPTELFGIGKYGNDCYKIFCLGQWRTVESEDKYLNLYINWLWNACSKSSSCFIRTKGTSDTSK